MLPLTIHWCLNCSLVSLVVALSIGDPFGSSNVLNSRFNDQQPALSGDGRFIAFVTSRNGMYGIVVYDLQQQRLVSLPGLNQPETIALNPSLSYTGRYLAYLVNDQGKPTVALYDRAIKKSQLLSQGYRGWVRHPSISPDGRYIVFESGMRGRWDIEVLDRGPNIELDLPDDTIPKATIQPEHR